MSMGIGVVWIKSNFDEDLPTSWVAFLARASWDKKNVFISLLLYTGRHFCNQYWLYGVV